MTTDPKPTAKIPLPKAHQNWDGYTHGGCGTQLSSDRICDRPATHARSADATLRPHRAYDPSGSGQWVEFDDHGAILRRGPDGDPDARREDAKAAALRLATSERSVVRIAASRATGVSALLPPVSPVATPAEPTSPAATRRHSFELLAARQRVMLYVLATDAFCGDEMLDNDVIDNADGGSMSAPLLMSDLRTLAGVEVYEDAEGSPASRPARGW